MRGAEAHPPPRGLPCFTRPPPPSPPRPSPPPSRSFYCQLIARDATAGAPSTLSIVETNTFKQLTHLQLTLRSATDAGVKSYLAALLALSREQCGALEAASAKLLAECTEKDETILRIRASAPPPPSP